MDSANSGSLQSSSGGDEEYDSRAADSVSAFMSGGGGGGGGSISHAPPPFFDPLSSYLQLQQNSNSSLLNPNLSWPRTAAPPLRSDPNPIGHHDVVHSMFPASNSYMPCFPPAAAGMGSDGGSGSAASSLNHSQAAAARNPKKRSRASRRAPTTVLTTDTTNFRAMVQEFTGIPAPPFNSSSFPRSRLDFFGSRSAAMDASQPPPYLRRPFAQKIQPPHPFLASSSSSLLSSAALDAIAASSATNTPSAAAASPSINYQMQQMAQNSNLFNIQNQNQNQNLLSSLLQSNPKFPFSTTSIAISKPQNSYEIQPSENQFTHHQQPPLTLSGLPSLIPSDHNCNADVSNAARWSPAGDRDDRAGNLRPVNGGYDFSASSTSGFHGGKSPENNAAAAPVRGEGMVESWICSSE